uniref:Uncharacterized protein n=1 Tax=Tetranychus urticae TaxID=32264 RepID=T1L1Q6_TETUR
MWLFLQILFASNLYLNPTESPTLFVAIFIFSWVVFIWLTTSDGTLPNRQ